MAPSAEDLLEEEEEEEPRKSRLGLGIFITGLIVLVLAAGGYGLYRMLGPSTKPPAKVAVPNVVGYTEEQATEQLTGRNLKVTVKHINGEEDSKGDVTAQDPLADVEVEVNSTVQITVNDGPKTGKIPTGLKGKSLDDVKKALDKAKFTNVVTDPAGKDPADAKANEVLSISPPEGSTIALDAKITVKYATGKSKVPVMTGKTPAQAESDARAAGFTKFRRMEEPSSETAGVVFAQDPPAGTTVSRGTTITYKVAVPKPTPTPTATSESPSASSTASPGG